LRLAISLPWERTEEFDMPTIDTPSIGDWRKATTLLQQIEQVVHWLPKYEPPRQDLVRGVAQIQSSPETLSRADILNLRVHVRRLRGGPLKTLLKQQVNELGTLYGLVPERRRRATSTFRQSSALVSST
jgi:hypothetical protein